MDNTMFSWTQFNTMPLVGIIRHFTEEQVRKIMPLYVAAGLSTIEITMNTTGAADLIRQVRHSYPGINTGAGTVCSSADLEAALAAGAQFIVTPVVDKTIIKAAVAANIPVFAGAFTPTEIFTAWQAGASLVKVYPAAVLGPGYIRDIKAPLSQIRLLPTGGIQLKDIRPYRDAGADGFGIGGPLFDKNIISKENWEGLARHFKQFADAVSN